MKPISKNLIRIKKIDNAVVGVVTAILLTALVVAVLSLVQTVYVPEIMEQREAEHMDVVADQFASLKSVIDSQVAAKNVNLPIATSITLGSKELPYLMSARAYGTLEIVADACRINITNRTTGDVESFPLGIIKYSSSNAYYLDQSYIYEAGAMIVSQSQGDLMMIRPSFSVKYEAGILTISFDMVNISAIGRKSFAAGYGTIPIQTEFVNVSVNDTIKPVQNINLTISHTNSWRIFITSVFENAGLQEITDFLITEETNEWIRIDIVNSALTTSIIVKVINIGAQVGPGWVD